MRYAKIYDIRELHSYRCITARLAYCWLVMSASYPVAEKRCSLEQLSRELGCTRSAARHALDVLQRDNLIMRNGSMVRLIDAEQPRPTQQQPQQLDALNILRLASRELEQTLGVHHTGALHPYFEQFLGLQKLAGKSWKDERDVKAHFASWYRKQLGSSADKATKEAAQRSEQAAAAQQQQQQNKQAAAAARLRNELAFYRELQQKSAAGNKEAADTLNSEAIQSRLQELKQQGII